MKRLFADSENAPPVARWWARGAGIGLAALFIVAEIHALGLGLNALWMSVVLVIVIAFFWEGIGGAIVALAALGIQAEVIMSEGSGIYGLDPAILVFVFAGLASYYCWWRTLRLSLTHQPA